MTFKNTEIKDLISLIKLSVTQFEVSKELIKIEDELSLITIANQIKRMFEHENTPIIKH